MKATKWFPTPTPLVWFYFFSVARMWVTDLEISEKGRKGRKGEEGGQRIKKKIRFVSYM